MSIVAVADQNNGIFSHGGKSGPHRYGSWVYFLQLGFSHGGRTLEVWGSSDGLAFAELDGANRVDVSPTVNDFDSYITPDDKIIAVYQEPDSLDPEFLQAAIVTFDPATNTWVAGDIGGGPRVQNLNTTSYYISPIIPLVKARSMTDIVVLCSGSLSSTPRPRYGYYNGATWTLDGTIPPEGILVGNSVGLSWPVDFIFGAGNILHAFFVEYVSSVFSLWMRTIDASNVLGSVGKLADIYDPTVPRPPLESAGFAAYDSVNQKIAMPYKTTGHTISVAIGDSVDSPSWTIESVDTTTVPFKTDNPTFFTGVVRELLTARYVNGTLWVYWLDENKNWLRSRRTGPATWTAPETYISTSDGRLVFERPEPSGYEGVGFERWAASTYQMYQRTVTAREPVYFMQ